MQWMCEKQAHHTYVQRESFSQGAIGSETD
jgi:hypothetical protein